jgi:hypothetical protein
MMLEHHRQGVQLRHRNKCGSNAMEAMQCNGSLKQCNGSLKMNNADRLMAHLNERFGSNWAAENKSHAARSCFHQIQLTQLLVFYFLCHHCRCTQITKQFKQAFSVSATLLTSYKQAAQHCSSVAAAMHFYHLLPERPPLGGSSLSRDP